MESHEQIGRAAARGVRHGFKAEGGKGGGEEARAGGEGGMERNGQVGCGTWRVRHGFKAEGGKAGGEEARAGGQ